MALLLRCLLRDKGFEIWMTREEDMYVSLGARCEFANVFNADLFLSIHCDAWHQETTKGISTHIYSKAGVETEAIAEQIQIAMMKKFPDHTNRGLKRSDFYVLRRTHMPAVLVECEFLSNPDMRKWLSEPENQFSISHAIAGGIAYA